MKTTNVKAADLNFNRYTSEQYDRDIVNSIPFHTRIHTDIKDYLMGVSTWTATSELQILDLGVGTGITSKAVRGLFPAAQFTVVDFSEQMMNGAREKLGTERVKYMVADYAEAYIGENKFDLALCVIGLHHQNDKGKRKVFRQVVSALKPYGIFVFADLVTFRNPHKAALAAARHYHHLVEKATDEKALTDWAHHHMFLNQLAPLEDQVSWLKRAGFGNVEVLFQQFETALIIAR